MLTSQIGTSQIGQSQIGAALSTATTSGTITAPVAAISGTGTTSVSGSASVSAPVVAISGSGDGARIIAPAASLSGTGTTSIDGTGGVSSPSVGILGYEAGSGITVPAAQIAGTGSVATIIRPDGITSTSVFGAPTFRGGPQRIILSGITSTSQFGLPRFLQTGSQPLRCHVAGKNAFLSKVAEVSYERRMGGRSTATFQLDWPAGSTPIWPLPGQTVKITENYRTKFSGFLMEVTTEVIPGTNGQYRWDCTAADLSIIGDRRTVDATYAAGPVRAHILDAASRFLDGENITTNNVTTTSSISQERAFAKKTFTEFMNQMCSETGDIWFFDEFGDINCFAPSQGPAAPIQITIGPNSTVRAGLKVKRTLIGVVTQAFVRTDQPLGAA